MTTIIVAPIDVEAEGSFDEITAVMDASGILQGQLIYDADGLGRAPTMRELAAAMRQLRELIRARATTDDGSDLDAALAKISMTQLKQLSDDLGNGASEPVPTKSAVPLRLPPSGTALRRNGSKS